MQNTRKKKKLLEDRLLQAQKEYLDAVAANDLPRIQALQQRYSTKRTECKTSPSLRQKSSALDPETPGPSSMTDGARDDFARQNNQKRVGTLCIHDFIQAMNSLAITG